MKLLLDEMLSPQIARKLRDKGHDVQAVKRDRPELESIPDEIIVQRMSEERRGVVTNNVKHFRPIHRSTLATGKEHYGILFSEDATMPRSRPAITLWVETLDRFLQAHPGEDALKNRTHFLP